MQYTLTRPTPHSLNTIQVSWYGNWTVCSWVGESGGKNNACNANDKPPSSVHHPPAGSVTRFTWGRVRELINDHNSSNRPKSDDCLYELFWSQRPRKSPPAVMSASRETSCIYICVCVCVCVYIYTYIHICVSWNPLYIYICVCVCVLWLKA